MDSAPAAIAPDQVKIALYFDGGALTSLDLALNTDDPLIVAASADAVLTLLRTLNPAPEKKTYEVRASTASAFADPTPSTYLRLR